MDASIEVDGLKEFARDLRTIKPRLEPELKKAHRHTASTLAEESQRRMRALPVPKATAAASGIVARPVDKGAAVSMLGENPWVRAVEFGAETHTVFGRRIAASSMRRRVFAPWSGAGDDAGYALQPALRIFLASSKFEPPYVEALDRAHRKAFPEGHL